MYAREMQYPSAPDCKFLFQFSYNDSCSFVHKLGQYFNPTCPGVLGQRPMVVCL